MTTRLQPLTPAEIARMRDLYASGPLYTGGTHEALTVGNALPTVMGYGNRSREGTTT